jgi:hypothetical protein
LPRSLYLPASFRNPRKKVFVSTDTDPPLPHLIPPMSEEVDKKIIQTIITEINTLFGLISTEHR